jgi:hypothetical protein
MFGYDDIKMNISRFEYVHNGFFCMTDSRMHQEHHLSSSFNPQIRSVKHKLIAVLYSLIPKIEIINSYLLS